MVKKVARRVALVVAALVVLLLLLAGYTQTRFFRDQLRGFALSKLTSLYDAEIQIGQIEGNLITGFAVDSVSVLVGSRQFLRIDRIEAEYNPFLLLQRKIEVDRLTLFSPRFSFETDRNGKWNIPEPLEKGAADSSSGSPFDWTVILAEFRIVDGECSLVDSAALLRPEHGPINEGFIEYHNLHLSDIRLTLKADIIGERKQVKIDGLSFTSSSPPFDVRQLSGSFLVTDHEARVGNLTILTKRSSVELDASMEDFNILKRIELSDLKTHPISLQMRNSDVSLDELSRFIPDLDFLKGTVSMDLEADGTFGEVRVSKLHLTKGETIFHINGGVYNLHRPEDLYLDVRFSDSRLYSPDVRATLPEFNLPDLESLGNSTFDLAFVGRPDDFQTKIDLTNRAGGIRSDAHLVIGGPNTLVYNGVTEFRGLDLSVVLGDSGIRSRLNGSARVDGKGVDLQHLAGTMDLALDSSVFLGNEMHPSEFKIKMEQDNLEGTVKLELGSLNASLTTKIERVLSPRPAFTISGLVKSLDLAEILHDGRQNSDITMSLDATGEGLKWDDLSGNFRIDFQESRYQDYRIDSGSVRLTVNQDDPMNKEIHLLSSIADISLTGAYDLRYMLDLISFERENLQAAIEEKFAILDSSLGRGELDVNLGDLAAELSEWNGTLDAAFSITVKNLEPVSFLTGDRRFNGVGSLTGTIKGNFSNLSLKADLDAGELFYGSAESGFYIQGGTVGLELEDLLPLKNPLDTVRAQFVIEAGDLHLNRSVFDSLQATIFLADGLAQFAASGGYEGVLEFLFGVQARVSETGLLIQPQELLLGYKGDYWSLSPGAVLEFRNDGASFDHIVMVSDTQEVRLDGRVESDGALSASLTVDKIGLNFLEDFLRDAGGPGPEHLVGGVASVTIQAEGTVTEPQLHGSLEAREVAFRGLPFGEMVGQADYQNGIVSLRLSVSEKHGDEDGEPKLVVEGKVPLSLPFSENAADEEVSLSILSNGIQINFLDPLVPTFDDLSGILRCDLRILGKPDELRYDGSFSLEDCTFLFEPNNIRYRFSGQFEPGGNRIRVITAVVRNIPSDNTPGRNGEIRFSGDFALNNFVPTDFNLVAKGELLVVKPESRHSSLPLYGELYVETGTSGLSFTGSIQKSLLQGDVLLRRSRLILLPARSGAARTSELSVPVIVLDDTSHVHPADELTLRERYFAQDRVSDTTRVDSYLPKKSFLDGVEYNLNVETSGPSSEIRIVFSELPVEELEATFQGKWAITGDGTRWIGDLTIDHAQYTFFKQFDATGRLRYSGEFMNPELDITATYQSTRTIQNAPDSVARTEKVVVQLKITGTRKEPKQEMSMTIDDIDYYSYNGPKSSDLESDAISFILAGTFPLSRPESNTIATDLETSLGASMVVGASSLLTKELSEYLRRETGFITSVELGYEAQGSFRQSADIRLSGTAFKGYWRYRGTILDNPFGNANVSLIYSFGDIFGNPSFRNFMFELERRTDVGTSGLIDDRKEVNSARLFYRFSF